MHRATWRDMDEPVYSLPVCSKGGQNTRAHTGTPTVGRTRARGAGLPAPARGRGAGGRGKRHARPLRSCVLSTLEIGSQGDAL